jgi:predicted TIM-barrel fold metal-dependent hydrolase
VSLIARPPFVDTNVHLIADDATRCPRAPLGGAGPYRVDHLTVEEYLAYMGRAGVHQAVLINAVSAHGYDNSYTADSAARFPHRFACVANIDGFAPDAPDQLSYWIESRGMNGVRFYRGDRVVEPLWLDDPALRPALERLAELGVPLDAAPLSPSTIPALRRVLTDFPHIPVIVSMLAHPDLSDGPPYAGAQGLFSLAEFPNAYPKIAFNNLHDAAKGQATPESFFTMLVDRFGPERIICSSYFPGRDDNYAGVIEHFRTTLSFLSAERQQAILGETARTLYPSLRNAAVTQGVC